MSLVVDRKMASAFATLHTRPETGVTLPDLNGCPAGMIKESSRLDVPVLLTVGITCTAAARTRSRHRCSQAETRSATETGSLADTGTPSAPGRRTLGQHPAHRRPSLRSSRSRSWRRTVDIDPGGDVQPAQPPRRASSSSACRTPPLPLGNERARHRRRRYWLMPRTTGRPLAADRRIVLQVGGGAGSRAGPAGTAGSGHRLQVCIEGPAGRSSATQ